MVDINAYRADTEMLLFNLDPGMLNFETTDDIPSSKGVIGQQRALNALKLGMEINSSGYNIFVTGLRGTGKMTTVRMILDGVDKERKIPDDICYVNNFKNSDMPLMITLPPGKGKLFQKAMENYLDMLRKHIPEVFESEAYQKKKNEFIKVYRDKEKEITHAFDKKVKDANFTLIQIQSKPFPRAEVMPLIDNAPVSIFQLEAMVDEEKYPKEEYEKILQKYNEFSEDFQDVIAKTKRLQNDLKEVLEELDKEIVIPFIDSLLNEIKKEFSMDSDKLSGYLNDVREATLAELDRFQAQQQQPVPFPFPVTVSVDQFLEYSVNVIVDNSETEGSPVVIETFPTYKNIFGTIEKVYDKTGVWRTDFTKIKAGAFLRANGGYLVLNAFDVFTEPYVWQALRRTLRNQVIEIQNYDPFYLFSTSALKPEPIQADVKVIMVGDTRLYTVLYFYDEDFRKIFKVRADFDSVIKFDEEIVKNYTRFIKKMSEDENLKPFDKYAVKEIIEYGVRLSGRKNKLSLRFSDIADIIRESNYWADANGSSVVKATDVETAIKERRKRVNMLEDRVQELISEGTLLIDVEGEKVGQVNGLSIYDLGDYVFGKPSKITVEVSMGTKGIINIEREADLSGKIHSKGVLIIAGYLRGRYAKEKPLAVNATICFEQSYSGVDGDSASAAEIYAIHSAISGIPLRQDIAVTGSVNQKGIIQPIGGVNEKIEGFFDVCSRKGLTGNQGVIVPALNQPELMLRKDVIEAVKKGDFHIYIVKTIDEGMEILTGVEAGKRMDDGSYPEGSINFLVNQRLEDMAKKLKSFGAEKGEKQN